MKKLESERQKKIWKKKINDVEAIESIGNNLGDGIKHFDMRI